MEYYFDYKKDLNYIGNNEWQYKFTFPISRKCSGLNYTAFVHDFLYGHILYKEKGLINLILFKILIDLIFLVMGFFRSMRNFQMSGIALSIIFYLILLLHTPVYIYQMKKK